MSFRTTNRADQDLIDLYVDGGGQFGPAVAEQYFYGLLSLFDLLGDNPRLDRLRTEFAPPVRVHAYRSHLVIYTDDEHGVLIVRVLHGRQDWQAALT